PDRPVHGTHDRLLAPAPRCAGGPAVGAGARRRRGQPAGGPAHAAHDHPAANRLGSPLMAQVVHAAGAVVWREHRDRLEVLLIHRPRYDDWSWPKGKPRKKETLPGCAVREIAEETGIEVV